MSLVGATSGGADPGLPSLKESMGRSHSLGPGGSVGLLRCLAFHHLRPFPDRLKADITFGC